MNVPLRLRRLQIFPLAIRMRLRFEHAAASRAVADPVVLMLEAEAPHAKHIGLGETLAREYVTGETAATVLADLRTVFAPWLVDLRAASFADVVAFCAALPFEHAGRSVTAARAAVEVALLDLGARVFGVRVSEAAGIIGLDGFGPPGCAGEARYSGIVVGKSATKLRWMLRVQRWYGLRNFKIKVAVPGWERRLEWAHGVLRDDLARGRATLRADANGGWTYDEAVAATAHLERCGVSALEQPLAKADDARLPKLARALRCDLIADESLVSLADAQRLVDGGGVRVFNVRIAKNGGLLPALRIAHAALAAGKHVQLGCLVGETSILTAAGAAFLEACPCVRFVEGAFGRRLLHADVTRPSLRFGYGGRAPQTSGPGLGLTVDEAALRRWSTKAVASVSF